MLQQPQGQPLVYLDSAATTLKPHVVIEEMSQFYRRRYATVHRGVYRLAEAATADYEGVRERLSRFVGAVDRRGVIFTKNATEAINLVSYAWAQKQLRPEDELVVTELEHHSNFLPWQQAAQATGARLRAIPITAEGRLDLDALEEVIGPRTRLVALSGLSNVFGTPTPLKPIIGAAKAVGALVLVDGAQMMMHQPVDLRALGVDFFAFSGHKMMGPTGVGVLVARPELLEGMDPFLTGGEMVLDVSSEGARWNELPYKFEAGTPMVAEVIGLGAALDYLEQVGLARIAEYEHRLWSYGRKLLGELEGLRFYGLPKVPVESSPSPPASSSPFYATTFCFNLEDGQGGLIHPHDVGTVLANEGVAIRVGHHCARPLMRRLGVAATCRASLSFYNNQEDLEALASGLGHVLRFFRKANTSRK
jgi:cysteine desulfurase/selenocysteine lyase